MRRPLKMLTVVSVGLLLVYGVGQVKGASFYEIGLLPGGTWTEARDVSANGCVVGHADSSLGHDGFLWKPWGQMIGLGSSSGWTESWGYGVSADASVVVGWGTSPNGTEAFRWTPSGGIVGLGDLPGGVFSSDAFDVSADGNIVAGRSLTGTGYEAFRWTSAGGMVGLGDLPGGSYYSIGRAVSADGSVVTGCSNSASGYEAYRWTAATGMVGLGDLPGGTFYSLAEAISADGSAIAGASQSGNGYEAFLWTIAAGMIPLGDLPGGDFWSEAWSVSDGKVVVGRGRTASGGAGERAFIWDATHGMRELKTVLENEYGLNLGGWTLSTGTGISPDGTIIMGNGLSPTGRNTGWVVFLPEPSTFALLLGAGVASLLAYAWRRRKRAA